MEDLSGGGERERDRSFTWETSLPLTPPAWQEDSAGQTDLMLAAKLGKNLLEQNEELSAEYYKIVRKLEVGCYVSHGDIISYYQGNAVIRTFDIFSIQS